MRPNISEDYLRASVGLDYSFGGETYAFIEYHFNGAGAKMTRKLSYQLRAVGIYPWGCILAGYPLPCAGIHSSTDTADEFQRTDVV